MLTVQTRETYVGLGCRNLKEVEGLEKKGIKEAISSRSNHSNHQHNNHNSSTNYNNHFTTLKQPSLPDNPNNTFKMFSKTAIFTVFTALMAKTAMAAPAPEKSNDDAQVSIMIATDAYFACNEPNNGDYTQGTSCKYLSGPSSGDSYVSGSKLIPHSPRPASES